MIIPTYTVCETQSKTNVISILLHNFLFLK